MRCRAALAFAAGIGLAGPAAAQTWRYEAPVRAERTAFLANRRIGESSGVAVSRRQPGVLWTHNDSGNDANVYATDTLGHDLGTFRVVGATNVDWEAIRLAPCAAGSCMYIGDIGDNEERRADVVVYRLPEPKLRRDSLGPIATAPAQALRIRYPDGPHDAEAMVLTPVGDILIITKGIRGVRMYRVPLSAWDDDAPVTADSLGTLPLPPDGGTLGQVTDAALSPDDVHVVVRTYSALFFFRLTSDALVTDEPPRACTVLGLEMQGEGVDWLDAVTLVLTSERALAPASSVSVVRCPSMM